MDELEGYSPVWGDLTVGEVLRVRRAQEEADETREEIRLEKERAQREKEKWEAAQQRDSLNMTPKARAKRALAPIGGILVFFALSAIATGLANGCDPIEGASIFWNGFLDAVSKAIGAILG